MATFKHKQSGRIVTNAQNREGVVYVVPHPITGGGYLGKVGTEWEEVPEFTWADHELLQELHKEQAAKKRRFAALTKGQPLQAEDVPMMEDLNQLREARDSRDAPQCRCTITALQREQRIEGVPESVHRDIDKDETIAELQDQIKDWEAKCSHLEQLLSTVNSSLSAAIEIKNKYLTENQQLSKSLQHYRAAYFADQGEPPVLPAKGAAK